MPVCVYRICFCVCACFYIRIHVVYAYFDRAADVGMAVCARVPVCHVPSENRGGINKQHTLSLLQNEQALLLPFYPQSLARGFSGSTFFYAPGNAVQGRSSRAPSSPCPSLDIHNVLSFTLSPLAPVETLFNTIDSTERERERERERE